MPLYDDLEVREPVRLEAEPRISYGDLALEAARAGALGGAVGGGVLRGGASGVPPSPETFLGPAVPAWSEITPEMRAGAVRSARAEFDAARTARDMSTAPGRSGEVHRALLSGQERPTMRRVYGQPDWDTGERTARGFGRAGDMQDDPKVWRALREAAEGKWAGMAATVDPHETAVRRFNQSLGGIKGEAIERVIPVVSGGEIMGANVWTKADEYLLDYREIPADLIGDLQAVSDSGVAEGIWGDSVRGAGRRVSDVPALPSRMSRAGSALKSGLRGALNPASILTDAAIGSLAGAGSAVAGYASAAPQSAGLFTAPGPGYEGVVSPELIERIAEQKEMEREARRQQYFEEALATGAGIPVNARISELAEHLGPIR